MKLKIALFLSLLVSFQLKSVEQEFDSLINMAYQENNLYFYFQATEQIKIKTARLYECDFQNGQYLYEFLNISFNTTFDRNEQSINIVIDSNSKETLQTYHLYEYCISTNRGTINGYFMILDNPVDISYEVKTDDEKFQFIVLSGPISQFRN